MSLKGSGGGGGGVSAGSVRAGQAFIELWTKDDGLKAGLARAQKTLSSWAAGAAKAGAVLLGAGGGVLGGFGKLMSSVVGSDVDLGRFAAKLGESTERLSAFLYAAELGGQSMEKVQGHYENFSERIAQAALGAGEGAEAFKRLGIDAQSLLKMGAVDQMLTLADAMEGVTDETEKLGIMSKLGGDKFQDMKEVLAGGSAVIRAKMEEAAKAGAVRTKEQVEQATKINAAWVRMKTAVVTAVMEIGRAFYPQTETIGEFADAVVNTAAEVRQFITANREAIQIAVGVATAVAGAGAAFVAIGGVMAAASVAIGGVVSAAGAAASVFAFLLTPVGLATAAVVAAGVALGYLFATSEQGKSILADLGAYFAETAETAKTTWGGIAAALKAGDLALAGKVAMAGLEVEFRRVVLAMQVVWTDFKSFFVDAFHGAGLLVQLAIVDVVSFARKHIGGLLDELQKVNQLLPELLQNPVLNLADAMKGLDPEKVKDEIHKIHNREQDEREKFRKGELDVARAAVEAARADLARLVAEAGAAADRAGVPPAGGGPPKSPSQVAAIARSAGQFGAEGIRQAFSVGQDVNKQQLGALLNGNKIAAEDLKVNRQILAAVQKGGPRFS